METIRVVLWIMFGIGAILSGPTLFQNATRKSYALLVAGDMLVIPLATFNLLTENGILWKIMFASVFLSGLIAVFNLASYTKEK